MRELEFDRPVHILLGGAGRIRPVSNAHDAADILLHQRPTAAKVTPARLGAPRCLHRGDWIQL